LSPEDLQKWPKFGSDDAKAQIKNRLKALYPKMSNDYKDQIPFPLLDLINMSELPWFKRVWIIQELAVSKDFEFMCGQWTVPGDRFVASFLCCTLWVAHEARQDISSFLQDFFGAKVQGGEVRTVDARATNTLGAEKKLQRDHLKLKQQLCNAFVLSSAEGLDVTDARDRIYAFLGFASDAEELNINSTAEAIDRMYKRMSTALYTDVARKLIERGHVDILSLCRAPTTGKPHDSGLPSWAPG
jgi:hypothetical protein